MEKCEIVIKTHTKGGVSLLRARGLAERVQGGIAVRYPHEGEEVLLTLGEGMLRMERESLSMCFRQGMVTEARIRTGGLEGSIPLKTRYYALESNERSHSAALKYELGGPAQKFVLSIRIDLSSEER